MTCVAARPCAWLFATALLLSSTFTAGAAYVPYLTGRVVDNAEILKPATRERVAALAKAHEGKATDQIAVLTIPTLGGDSVEEVASRVFAAWKLGQEGKDNGVLVVAAPRPQDANRSRLRARGALPDVVASRIIRNVMMPRSKSPSFERRGQPMPRD